ncbi:hypothetical protein [Nesterenkonia sp. PF2B19]|uniref:hypothetical protein n=1 Tax=Nesterenkonia sp. PF2B19 TaxID=1881858 RepID=UPI000871D386|nr:hypothetical protein [Nesterenkonia sp. PF2B19]OSM44622.1 hypothetical protein BCY76_001655 [Nesterenkonia sp. PF2B19]
MPDDPLLRQIETFPHTTNKALETVAGSGHHVEVTQARRSLALTTPEQGILLQARRQPVMRLSLKYVCRWSQDRQYMAIQTSSVRILPLAEDDLAPEERDDFPATNEPLVRFDYERESNSVPASHLNVHSHHRGLEWIMQRGHPKSRSVRYAPRTEKLHFPTGGHRFRPCLEDILEALAGDFGIDIAEGGRRILREQRSEFRRRQLAAAVGDDTETAADALRSKGYQVTLPPSASPTCRQGDRLEAL